MKFISLLVSLVGAILLASDPVSAQCSGTPSANTICAGPPSGGAGQFRARALVPSDLLIGTAVQGWDADLDAIAGLSTAADKLHYWTGPHAAALMDFPSWARAVIGAASASAGRASFGLAIGSDVQAYHANLSALSGLTGAAGKIGYFTAAGVMAMFDSTSFGRSVVNVADAAALRSLGGVVPGTNVQAWDADLDAIAALSGTNTLYYRSGPGAWSPVSIGSNLTFSGGTLSATGSGGGGVTDEDRRNIVLNGIRNSKALGLVQPIVNGVAEGFGGSDGINVGASSGYALDTGNKRVINTASDVYTTDVSPAVTGSSGGYGGAGVRLVVAAAAYASSSNGDRIRVTLRAPNATNPSNISAVWVGHKGGSAPNFDGGQVQLKYGGATSFALPVGGGDIVLDPAIFAFDHTKDLVISVGLSGTSNISGVSGLGANYNQYEKSAAAADASSTTVSGYSNNAGYAQIFSKVEIRTSTTINNMIVTGVGYDSLDFTPATLRISGIIEAIDAATLNTDATLEVSRDNGATWASATLTQYHTLGTKSFVESGSVDVTSQPSGTKPTFRYKTLNNKRVYLHGTSIAAAP